MAASDHVQSAQFHEMTRDEFESLPGTFFHGHPTGNFNWDTTGRPQGFHVGTKQAATEAVVARVGTRGAPTTYSGGERSGPTFPGTVRPVDDPNRPYTRSEYVAHPEHLRGGRIDAPMVNHPAYLGSYGKGDDGDMNGSGDVLANGKVAEINSKGRTMRQGIYYKNVAEDTGSVSAVLPSRQSFKTHEDYIVEARSRGLSIPRRALSGYRHVPGQQRLF